MVKHATYDHRKPGAVQRRTSHVELRKDPDTGLIKGLLSTYEDPKNHDTFGTVFARGAFAEDIAARGPQGTNEIPALWQHDAPFGMPVVLEDTDAGLVFHVKPTDSRENREDRLPYIEHGVVRGMSVGFVEEQSERTETKTPWGEFVYRITKARLIEGSIVTRPSNHNALIERARRAGLRWRKLDSGMWAPIERGEAMRKRCTCGAARRRGEALSAKLEEAIAMMIPDPADEEAVAAGPSRADIVAMLAEAADRDEGVVNEIIAGTIECPPLEVVEAFESVLDVEPGWLVTAWEEDGCAPMMEDENEVAEENAARYAIHLIRKHPRAAMRVAMFVGEQTRSGRVLSKKNDERLGEVAEMLTGAAGIIKDIRKGADPPTAPPRASAIPASRSAAPGAADDLTTILKRENARLAALLTH